jgi:hypothetical protein
VAARRGLDRGEELTEPVARLAVEPAERVEQVAVEQLRVEARERAGLRHVVEAERVADREQRAALARLEREGAAQRGEVDLPRAVRVGLRHRRRGRAVLLGALAHGLPDLVLGAPARERVGGEPLALAPAQPGWAACRAAPKAAERACQRPSSTHETGIAVSEPAATSTVTLRIRFCFAPISSSPS